MSLKATIKNGVFTVSGDAIVTNGRQVEVRSGNLPFSVKDNGSIAVEVPISSDGSAVETVDVRGLHGAGAFIDTRSVNGQVYGSAQSDAIYTYGSFRNTVDGGDGSDTIGGYAGRDRLLGGNGSDSISAGDNNDTLIGGRGSDTLNGGNDFDVAIYSGDRSDYQLSISDGVFLLTDLRRNSPDGTDTLANIEELRFRDGTVEMPAAPTYLAASIKNGVFTVSGDAIVTNGRQVEVRSGNPPFSVKDNGSIAIEVPISSDGSAVETVDVRGLHGAGALIDTRSVHGQVYGSAQSDAIYTYGSFRNTVDGGDGSDTIGGYAGRDRLLGGNGSDSISAGDNNDTLIGGRGSDTLNGGNDFDVAIYSGDRSDYQLSISDGVFLLTDLRRNSPDGTDTLANIEELRFRDGTVEMPAAPTYLAASIKNGVFTVSGDAIVTNGRQVEVRSGNPPFSVKDNGSIAIEVPISSDGSAVETVDVRGLHGAGALIDTRSVHGQVYGSAQSDAIYTYGSFRNTVDGGDGSDTIGGYAGRDRLLGGNGGDSISAGDNNDTLIGGRGSDTLNGGNGLDVAIYSSDRSDYQLSISDGVFLLTDLRRNSPDGTDTLANIEELRFRDGSFLMSSDVWV